MMIIRKYQKFFNTIQGTCLFPLPMLFLNLILILQNIILLEVCLFILFFILFIIICCIIYVLLLLIRCAGWYWSKTENRRRFFERYAKDNHFDALIPENWYSISEATIKMNHVRRGRKRVREEEKRKRRRREEEMKR